MTDDYTKREIKRFRKLIKEIREDRAELLEEQRECKRRLMELI